MTPPRTHLIWLSQVPSSTLAEVSSLAALLEELASSASASALQPRPPPAARASAREIHLRDFAPFMRCCPTPAQLARVAFDADDARQRASESESGACAPSFDAAAGAAARAAQWVDGLSAAARGQLLAAVRRSEGRGALRPRAFRIVLRDLYLPPITDSDFEQLVRMIDCRNTGAIALDDAERTLGWGAQRFASPPPTPVPKAIPAHTAMFDLMSAH